MEKLTITLKQHTPLIHFQHYQDGATLRASEVKPKLDRFIVSRIGRNEAITKGWLMYPEDPTKDALKYKLRFKVKETPSVFHNNEIQKDRQGVIQTQRRRDGRIVKRLKPYPLFFANLNADIEDPEEYKKFSFLNDPFEMEIMSFNSDLIAYIQKGDLLAGFFQSTNFGTRQSKGFGSFYIDEQDDRYTEISLKYRFSVDITSNANKWINLFNTIDLFYKSLRSGINICWGNQFYMKSAIFKYAQNKNKDWDKKLIKQFFLEGRHPEGNNNYLFKDLLGLSSDEAWKSYNTSIKKTNNEIKRFQSPIFIKPIENDGYFDVFVDSNESVKPLFEPFLNKCFAISSQKHPGHLELKTFPQFDIDEFLEFALLQNDIAELTQDRNHDTFLLLKEIYDEIKTEHEHE